MEDLLVEGGGGASGGRRWCGHFEMWKLNDGGSEAGGEGVGPSGHSTSTSQAQHRPGPCRVGAARDQESPREPATGNQDLESPSGPRLTGNRVNRSWQMPGARPFIPCQTASIIPSSL